MPTTPTRRPPSLKPVTTNSPIPWHDHALPAVAPNGQNLVDFVSSDEQVMAAMTQRVYTLIAAPWRVKPGDESPLGRQAARLVEHALQQVDFDSACAHLLFGRLRGFAACEMHYQTAQGEISLKNITPVPAAAISINHKGQFHLRADDKPLPENKFWRVTFRHLHGQPQGDALASWLYWLVLFKRQGIRDWVKQIEKAALPTVVGYYPHGTTDNDQQLLLEAARLVREETAIVMPEGMRLTLLGQSTASASTQDRLVNLLNESISKLILGATMTSDTGSSRAQAEVHERTRDCIIKADADLLTESFSNQVARWLTDWNFGANVAAPRIIRDLTPPEDLDSLVARTCKLAGLGLKPDPDWVRQTFAGNWQHEKRDNPQSQTTGDEQERHTP